MSFILVDSNVLLDVITDDPKWSNWSADQLETFVNSTRFVINAVIYSEISVHYSRADELDELLPASIFDREPIPFAAAFLAGKCFSLYRSRGGVRRSPLPDFFIGAHAVVSGYRLLTRDAARYRTYFPKLEIIAPD